MIKDYGELRKLLKDEKNSWIPDEEINDNEKPPQYSLGGEDDPVREQKVEKLDFKKILDYEPANPFLLKRRKDENIIPTDPDTKPSSVINPVTNDVIDLETLEED